MLTFRRDKIIPENRDATLLRLLQRIQQGEQAALGQLYDLTLPKVYGLVMRIVCDPADAEEVTCDVYHQVWRSAQQFDLKRGNPSQWLLVIARSRALDCYRKRRQRHNEVHLPHGVDSYSVGQSEDAECILQTFQANSAVQGAIANLSAVQAELVTMAFFQGLSHQEISEAKKLPLGTVKSHLNRASIVLRRLLSAADIMRNA